jgi:hypothetical protein
VLPVDQLQLLQLAAIVADGDDVGFEALGESLVGDPFVVLHNEAEEFEDLLVVGPVEVEAELLATVLLLILFLGTLASRPHRVIFFSRRADRRSQLFHAHRSMEETVRRDKTV